MRAGLTPAQLMVAKAMQTGGALQHSTTLVDDDRFSLQALLDLSPDEQTTLVAADIAVPPPVALASDRAPEALGVLGLLGGYIASSVGEEDATSQNDYVSYEATTIDMAAPGLVAGFALSDSINIPASSHITLDDTGTTFTVVDTGMYGFVMSAQLSIDTVPAGYYVEVLLGTQQFTKVGVIFDQGPMVKRVTSGSFYLPAGSTFNVYQVAAQYAGGPPGTTGAVSFVDLDITKVR